MANLNTIHAHDVSSVHLIDWSRLIPAQSTRILFYSVAFFSAVAVSIFFFISISMCIDMFFSSLLFYCYYLIATII